MTMAFEADDLVLVGMPVYSGRLPAISAEIFQKMVGNQAKAVAVAVYGNRHYDDALLELTNELADHGFKVIAGGAVIAEHCFISTVGENRPDDDDKAKLLEIAAQIQGKLAAGDEAQPPMPGNDPYKPLPTYSYPTGNDACVACGLCAKNCPVEAIDFDNPKETDPELCIFCGRCMNICPQGARSLWTDGFKAMQQRLVDNCSQRREMEWSM
jgi:ferredoxin